MHPDVRQAYAFRYQSFSLQIALYVYCEYDKLKLLHSMFKRDYKSFQLPVLITL